MGRFLPRLAADLFFIRASFCLVEPTEGRRGTANAARPSAAVIAFWGDRPRSGGGSQNSVIDSKQRRLKCLRPIRPWALPRGNAKKDGANWRRAGEMRIRNADEH